MELVLHWFSHAPVLRNEPQLRRDAKAALQRAVRVDLLERVLGRERGRAHLGRDVVVEPVEQQRARARENEQPAAVEQHAALHDHERVLLLERVDVHHGRVAHVPLRAAGPRGQLLVGDVLRERARRAVPTPQHKLPWRG